MPFGAHACKWLLAKLDASEIDMAKFFQAIPPHSPEAEAALLGSMILDGNVVPTMVRIGVFADDLFIPKNRIIFQTISDLYYKAGIVDMVLLKDQMVDDGTLKRIGGLPYLLDLANSVPSAASAEHYAAIVHEKAERRRRIDQAVEMLKKAYKG